MVGNKVKIIFGILAVFCLMLSDYILGTVMADDTGLRSPSLSVAGGQYTNPDNAFSSDNAYATNSTNNQSQQYANFGFSIPAGSTINGIEVKVEGKTTSTTNNPRFEITISGDNGGSFSSPNSTGDLTTTDAVYTMGGSTDLWGGSWNQSNFSNANFIVKVKSKFGGTTRTLSLDHLQVKVYYTLPPLTTTTTTTTLPPTTTTSTTTTTTTSTTTTTVPTIVTLVNFTAAADDDGKVALTWETASEINNAGFNIYRARRKSGNYIQLNNATIDPRGDETYGASYSFVDTPPGPGTYYYKLEDVEYGGVRTMHGPVKVRVGYSAVHRR